VVYTYSHCFLLCESTTALIVVKLSISIDFDVAGDSLVQSYPKCCCKILGEDSNCVSLNACYELIG
jgi:hypothetical protein